MPLLDTPFDARAHIAAHNTKGAGVWAQVLLQSQRMPQLLSTAAAACAMREVDAVKPALAFLTHSLQLPVSDPATAAVGWFVNKACCCCWPCMTALHRRGLCGVLGGLVQ